MEPLSDAAWWRAQLLTRYGWQEVVEDVLYTCDRWGEVLLLMQYLRTALDNDQLVIVLNNVSVPAFLWFKNKRFAVIRGENGTATFTFALK